MITAPDTDTPELLNAMEMHLAQRIWAQREKGWYPPAYMSTPDEIAFQSLRNKKLVYFGTNRAGTGFRMSGRGTRAMEHTKAQEA